jgi:branched-chain amino acid transport system ATP-binding protein
MSLLNVNGLKVQYGGIQALSGISFQVEKGQIVSLIGANGAGKSTTLRAITSLVPMAGGSIEYEGEDITTLDTQQMIQRGIVLVPEGRRVFPNLSTLENLKVGAYTRRDAAGIAGDIEKVYTLFPRLKERHWQLAGTLSGGEQQMLAVGRALMARPKLLMMDEPSLGLAPLVVRDIFQTVLTLHGEGITILLVEQNANAALKIADRGYVLETGRITITGTGKELLETPKVREAYLGRSSTK